MTQTRQWMKEWSAWRRRMRRLGHPAQAVIDAQTGGIRYSAPVRAGFEFKIREPSFPKVKAQKASSPLTARILRIQGRNCYLCGYHMAAPTREHVVPQSKGGKNAGNILMACQPCNVRKGNRDPHPCERLYAEAVHLRLKAATAELAA